MKCSDRAKVCPYCGAPDPLDGKRKANDKRLAWRIVGAVWLMIVVGLSLAI